MALASQDITLRAFCTSVEFTMRRAARDQRGGQSMLFDAMCAMEVPIPAASFPRVEERSRSLRAGTSPSKCSPRVVESDETECRASEVCVRYPPFFSFCFRT